VVVVVLAPQVVDVAGADQRPPDVAGDADDALVGLLLVGQPVLLELEEDVVAAEDLQQVVGVRTGVAVAPGDEALAEA
jgi:hypothetical protein